jgi:hypothetical protein
MTEQPTPHESELIEQIRSIDVRAPEALHERVAAMVSERERSGRGSRSPLRGRPALFGAVTAAGALAVVLVLALAGGGGGSTATPIVQSASTLTGAPSTGPAPAENPARKGQLLAAEEGVSFPYWEEHFGWRTTGIRVDQVRGRPATTVFYGNRRGQRISYTIVGGNKIPRLVGGAVTWHRDTAYRLVTVAGKPAVVWLRSGRLCVLSGSGVPAATLLRLASWTDHGGMEAT